MSVTPAAPSISETAAIGSNVATLSAAWSDGSPFAGSFQFAAPNFADGGLFQIMGNELVVSGDLGGLGGTVQGVTIEAVQ